MLAHFIYLPRGSQYSLLTSLNRRSNSWVGCHPLAQGESWTCTCRYAARHANHYTTKMLLFLWVAQVCRSLVHVGGSSHIEAWVSSTTSSSLRHTTCQAVHMLPKVCQWRQRSSLSFPLCFALLSRGYMWLLCVYSQFMLPKWRLSSILYTTCLVDFTYSNWTAVLGPCMNFFSFFINDVCWFLPLYIWMNH